MGNGKMIKERIAANMAKVPANLRRIFDLVLPGMKPPNRLVFGLGAAANVGRQAADLTGGRKALVISDEILASLGVVNDVASYLSEAGFKAEIFAKVEPEPHIETADMLYDLCAGKDFSVVIGLGGGSVMDMSKLTAQAVGRNRPPREYADRKAVPDKPGLPLILLPTTSGTGSEASPYFVVSLGEEKRFFTDNHYYPDIAVIDPTLTVSMPPMVTASTGIDALTHAMEGAMNKLATPFSDTVTLMSIEMVGNYLRRAVADGDDLEARYHMALAATFGMVGMVLGGGGLFAHSVSYVIPTYAKCTHGVGCALGLPYLMNYNLPVQPEKMARVAAAMGEPTWNYSKMDAAKLAVKAVANLMRDVGLPLNLQELGGLNESNLETMADRMMTLYPRPNNPRPMGKTEARLYWRSMWEGSL